MKGYSLLLAYHHDYNCLSESALKLVAGLNAAQMRLERFEAVKQQSERFYR